MALDLTPIVQAFLPKSLYGKAKAVVATILSVASAVLLVLPYFTQLPEQVGGIVGVVIAVLTPISVYLTGNETAHDPEHDGNSSSLTVEDTADKARYSTP